jgi:hypothetical protein
MSSEGCPDVPGRASTQEERVMGDYSAAYVAFDTAKMQHAVAIAALAASAASADGTGRERPALHRSRSLSDERDLF